MTLANHREYLNYNADEFKEWATGVGKSVEEVVEHFLTSGSVPEQGYKACVSLTKLGKRYGKRKLETVCERMLAFFSTPSVRTITTLLKNSSEPNKSAVESDNSNKYGITRGAACRRFKTVSYIRLPDLLDELTIARANNEFGKVIKAYRKVDLLILDEWLIRKLTPAESYDLLEIIVNSSNSNR